MSVTSTRWHPLVQALHWLGLLLVAMIAAIGLVMVDLPKGDATRSVLYATHKSLGIAALALATLRVLARWRTRAPMPPPSPAWQRRVAAASHALMYALLLALPLSGWLLNSVAGQPLPWFGLVDLPALAPALPDWRKPVDRLHVALFWTLAGVVAVHVLAVIHHHAVRRERILSRMLPSRRAQD
ncbi:MAG: cytochrome b [Xanthomonadales bacterium]|nr:cytochrome b [Xanthomonadales bacterium]